MYYNIVVKDLNGYSYNNELTFHFENNLQEALKFCEMILKTSNNSVEILQIFDKYESEE